MKRPALKFIMTAPSSLMTAPGSGKAGLYDCPNDYRHHSGYPRPSAFYLFTLLPFYLSWGGYFLRSPSQQGCRGGSFIRSARRGMLLC